MTAEEIQRYVLEVHAPLAQAEADRYGEDPWYLGSCDSTCAVLDEELGARLHPFRIVEWGGFRNEQVDPPIHDGHCWLEAPNGLIVDPTAEQFDLEPCAIVRAADPRQAFYRRPTAFP